MPVVRMTSKGRARKQSRVMLFGPPNSGKTTAAAFTSIKPAVLLSVPGEHGWAAIPEDIPGLIPLVWDNHTAGNQSSESIKREVETEVKKVIAGEYDQEFGKVRTLIIDGYHKMYSHYLNIGTAGLYNAGEDFEARLYTRAHRMSDAFLDLCLDSSLEFVTFTTWNAKELDKAGASGGPSHEYPDLPGKAAKEMIGKFSVVCFSRALQQGGTKVWEWLLKPNNEIWGNSVKLDARLAGKLPASCPQNFKTLYEIIGAAQTALVKEDEISNK